MAYQLIREMLGGWENRLLLSGLTDSGGLERVAYSLYDTRSGGCVNLGQRTAGPASEYSLTTRR